MTSKAVETRLRLFETIFPVVVEKMQKDCLFSFEHTPDDPVVFNWFSAMETTGKIIGEVIGNFAKAVE